MSHEHILVVEDEQHLAIGIKYNLEAEGYRVTVVSEGPTAIRIFEAAPSSFDLIVLDLMLPGMSGYDICEHLRSAGHATPIMILSARSLAEDRARGFDVGANQYLTKPFDLDELLSRVRNLLKIKKESPKSDVASRVQKKQCTELSFGDAHVNFETYEVRVGEKSHKLTSKELRLLRYFAENENRVISRAELLREVWEVDGDTPTRSVDQYMSRLRKTFEKDPAKPRHFLTFRDAGYRFQKEGSTDSGS